MPSGVGVQIPSSAPTSPEGNQGDVAKWQGRGLQNLHRRFESGRRLQANQERPFSGALSLCPTRIVRLEYNAALLIRLIALDLDGTLLRSDGSVSARTRAALAALEAARVIAVMVTARPPRRVREIAQGIGFHGVAICGNGAIVYDPANDLVLRQHALEALTARSLIEELRAAIPGICFATESGLTYGQEPAYVPHSVHRLDTEALISDALDLCESGVTKLIALHPARPVDELLSLTRELAGARAEVTHSGSPFVEIAAPGISKAKAVAELCFEWGIDSEEVVAFGDMPNDLPLLAWAGRSIAMANAHPEVRAVTHEVTLSNDDDGVAVILERLLS